MKKLLNLFFLLVVCFLYTLPTLALPAMYTDCYNRGFADCKLTRAYNMVQTDSKTKLKYHMDAFDYIALAHRPSFSSAPTCKCMEVIEYYLVNNIGYLSDIRDVDSQRSNTLTLSDSLGIIGNVNWIKIDGEIVYETPSRTDAEIIVSRSANTNKKIEVDVQGSYRYLYNERLPSHQYANYLGPIGSVSGMPPGDNTQINVSGEYNHIIEYHETNIDDEGLPTQTDEYGVYLSHSPYTPANIPNFKSQYLASRKKDLSYGRFLSVDSYLVNIDTTHLTKEGDKFVAYLVSKDTPYANTSKIMGSNPWKAYAKKIYIDESPSNTSSNIKLLETLKNELIKYQPVDIRIPSYFIVNCKELIFENNQANRDLVNAIANISKQKNIKLYLIGGYDDALFAPLLEW